MIQSERLLTSRALHARKASLGTASSCSLSAGYITLVAMAFKHLMPRQSFMKNKLLATVAFGTSVYNYLPINPRDQYYRPKHPHVK